MKRLLISELAEAVGLHPETLRRLERRGLITSRRDVNGWRRYDTETVEKVRSLYPHKEAPK
ncbi:MAG: MerR family transcriptional regulator [Nitrososphaerales archaeon]